MAEPRNFRDPRYVRWRKAVYARDGSRCRFPGCAQTRGLNAHHVRRWADHPALRYDVANGVSLCRTHHALVSGREEGFEAMFLRVVASRAPGKKQADDDFRIRMMMEKFGTACGEEE